MISAPKSTVTLFSPDPHQAKTHPTILIEDSQQPLVQFPKILGVYLDTSLSFNKHSGDVAERVSNRNNILKALAGTSWGQQKETLLMTYKAVGRSIINYAAPVWSTNLRDTNYRSIQYTLNEALRIATGCHKMSSVDHLHAEAKMLKVREHSELLSAQYLARCLEPGNVCHSITTRETPKRRMKETLFTRHRNTVEPMMLADNRKEILHAIHTDAVVVVYPLPWPLLVGGVRCSRLWSTSQLLHPSGQQCSHSGGVCPQIQGRQCGAYVGAVEEMMCVVCVDVTEGA